MNIILIGYRCAGKSTVGELLANKLGAAFVDCDDFIEHKTHLQIREIFELCGESYFRNLEGDAIAELCRADGRVIATGGGAAMRYKNIKNLKRNGVLIFLDVGPDSAFERIKKDPKSKTRRPALTQKDLLREVQEQISFRRTYYLNAADICVKSDERSADEIVKEIMKLLAERDFDFPGEDRETTLA